MSDEQQEKQEEQARQVGQEMLEDKCAEYLAGWKRALADYDNLKKDLGRERSEMRQAATADAVARIIPVLDNFDAAVKFVPEGVDATLRNWLMGILFIQTQLEEALRQMGLTSYGAAGDTFDANVHDAVGEQAETEVSPPAKGEVGGGGSQVVEVVARGWKLGEKIIRPAKVIISK